MPTEPGVFILAVEPGVHVSKGQLLGYTSDLLGKTTGEMGSPIDGIIVHTRGGPSTSGRAASVEVFPVLPMRPARRP